MATRSGGVTGVVYGLVTFVFLFVICLVLAILFYTQRNQAQERAEEASETLQDVVRADEQGNETYLAMRERSGDRSVISQFTADYQRLVNYLVGDPRASLAQVQSQLTDVGVLGRSGQGEDAIYSLQTNAVARIRTAVSRADAAEQEVAALEEAQSQRQQRVEQLRGELESAQQRHQQQLADLRQQLENRAREFNQFEQSLEQARQDALARLEQFREEAQQREDELRQRIAGLEQELETKDARIAELRRVIRANQLSGPDMTLEPDGRILDINPSEGTAVISLGEQDNLILGMSFAVFDEQTGVLTETQQNGRTVHVDEKGVLEVIRFRGDGQSAVARVVRQRFGQPLSAGDLISNVIYDPHRTFKFFVFGNFDLDGDNRATAGERDRIRNMIRTWGGRLIDRDQLPVDTDFVVLGAAPEFPREPAPTAPDSAWEQFRRDREFYNRYNAVVERARGIGIPILNQNRFLTLVGFYEQ